MFGYTDGWMVYILRCAPLMSSTLRHMTYHTVCNVFGTPYMLRRIYECQADSHVHGCLQLLAGEYVGLTLLWSQSM